MNKNKIKESVLDELISMMESKEVEGLKSKSPKFMKLEVEAIKPEMEDEMESEDKPMMDLMDDKKSLPEMEEKEESSPEDDDDMKRLLEMYRQLK